MSNALFKNPLEDRYFEDYIPGQVHEFGSVKIEESEIIAFARRFDPQPFHTDPNAAARSGFGRLVASGWHTASIMMRLFAQHFLSYVSSLGSPGVDEVRWPKPVFPGDELSIRVTVLDANLSRSKPDRGIIHSYIEVLNQSREVVMTMRAVNFIRCRG